MFDVQAKWVVNYIMGELKLPDKQEMESDSRKWITRYLFDLGDSLPRGFLSGGRSTIPDQTTWERFFVNTHYLTQQNYFQLSHFA